MTKLSGPMVPPADGSLPQHLVLLLHGYGSDGQDLIGLAGHWREILPQALFLAPNAPEPCRANPSGYQWFAIDDDRPAFRAELANAARPVITEFLADLWAQTGLGPAQTLLAGFSQGAMMALNTGLALDDALMGVVAFSGALIPPPGFDEDAGARPPVCLVHGDADTVVDPDFSVQALAALTAHGIDARLHVETGAGHTIAPDGLDFASRFIISCAARLG